MVLIILRGLEQPGLTNVFHLHSHFSLLCKSGKCVSQPSDRDAPSVHMAACGRIQGILKRLLEIYLCTSLTYFFIQRLLEEFLKCTNVFCK